MRLFRNRGRWRLALTLTGLLTIGLGMCGCHTLSFYTQAARGQYEILALQQPITEILADLRTSPDLRRRLELFEELRSFAETQLKLPVNGHYRKYADLRRPFVVWNVEAAPEFSMEPKKWWYPFLGRLTYRGYFSMKAATNYAAHLEKDGYDVFWGGVQAYSTLGWFKDPVLNTFIFEAEPELAELLFHELSHQRVFAAGDTDFNEAFATTVGREGARRWLRARSDPATLARYEASLLRNRQFADLVADVRRQLETLYGDQRTAEGEIRASSPKATVSTTQLQAQKDRILAELRRGYEQLKTGWNGDDSYDAWFSRELNNAQLNSVAAYYDLVPAFEELLEIESGDLPSFYAGAEALADMPKKKRHEWLRILERSGRPKSVLAR